MSVRQNFKVVSYLTISLNISLSLYLSIILSLIYPCSDFITLSSVSLNWLSLIFSNNSPPLKVRLLNVIFFAHWGKKKLIEFRHFTIQWLIKYFIFLLVSIKVLGLVFGAIKFFSLNILEN